jgi:hypothetical protein
LCHCATAVPHECHAFRASQCHRERVYDEREYMKYSRGSGPYPWVLDGGRSGGSGSPYCCSRGKPESPAAQPLTETPSFRLPLIGHQTASDDSHRETDTTSPASATPVLPPTGDRASTEPLGGKKRHPRNGSRCPHTRQRVTLRPDGSRVQVCELCRETLSIIKPTRRGEALCH